MYCCSRNVIDAGNATSAHNLLVFTQSKLCILLSSVLAAMSSAEGGKAVNSHEAEGRFIGSTDCKCQRLCCCGDGCSGRTTGKEQVVSFYVHNSLIVVSLEFDSAVKFFTNM